MNYIVLDLEFNQPFPFPKDKVIKTDPICPVEIIQIGAVKLNENFEVTGHFSSFVKPQIYKRLHPYVERITHIKPKDLQTQPYFPEVFQDFVEFIGISDHIMGIWGNDDVKFLFKNILYHEIDLNCISNKYINIQSYANKLGSNKKGQAIGLQKAVEELNIDCALEFHNALNDAIYTAEIFKIIKPEKIIPMKFNISHLLNTKKLPRINYKNLYLHIAKTIGVEELTPEERRVAKIAYTNGFYNDFVSNELDKNAKNTNQSQNNQKSKNKSDYKPNNNTKKQTQNKTTSQNQKKGAK